MTYDGKFRGYAILAPAFRSRGAHGNTETV